MTPSRKRRTAGPAPSPEADAGDGRPALLRKPWLGAAAVALAATVAAVATLAPEAGGPGIGCDEPYHVAYGKRLVHAWRQQGASFFARRNIEANFPWNPAGPPVHPPLGNWILGWTHDLFDRSPDDLSAVSVVPARFAPAIAYGLLVFLVGAWTAGAEGALAGTVAAAAAAIVPRVFGHAHMAALDMLTAFFFVAAALAVIEADRRGGRWWRFALAGGVWGLAMLVRLHGALLLPPVVLWLVWRLRRRVGLPLGAWLAAGGAVLYAGWPWLWLAPWTHLRQYLGTATARQAIQVFYFGQAWADHEVPRHYALVMFAVALPLGLLLLGLLGLWTRRRAGQGQSGFWLLMGSLGFVLLVFSLPGTPVYDGERLFLMVFPLWAVAVAAGAKWAHEHSWVQRWRPGARVAGIGALVAAQAIPLIVYHPLQLCHYSLLVGGVAGAERLGFEVDYWGVGITESLLRDSVTAAVGKRTGGVCFLPELAPYQIAGVMTSSPSLMKRGDMLKGWNPQRGSPPASCRYALIYRRRANLHGSEEALERSVVLSEESRQGVWIARLVELAEPHTRNGP